MLLNTDIVIKETGVSTVTNKLLIGNFGQDRTLPLDHTRIIFKNLKANLPEMALVCKNWKTIIDDKEFRQMIRPTQAFGTEEWKKYIDLDAGEEPRLPRRAYRDLEIEDGLLTFIPKIINPTKKKDFIEIPLTMYSIFELVRNLKQVNITHFTKRTLIPKIVEEPHWVWLKKEILGIKESYEDQKREAQVESERISGAHISGLIDTLTSVYMEYVRSGESNFTLDPSKNYSNFIRTADAEDSFRTCLGFTPSGLQVKLKNGGAAIDDVGFACAWKSFEI